MISDELNSLIEEGAELERKRLKAKYGLTDEKVEELRKKMSAILMRAILYGKEWNYDEELENVLKELDD